MKKRIIAFLLMSIMLMSSMTNVLAVSFSDLDSGHWAYEYITTLADQGVINGYTDGTFKAEKEITRGEFFKLIMTTLYGSKYFEINGINLGHWASMYSFEAYRLEYMMKDSSITDLDIQISRLEMAHVLAKICVKNNFKNKTENAQKIKFSDIKSLNAQSKEYIEIVVENELINGYTDGTFKPDKYMTRAEIATVIYRFQNLIY